MTTEDEISKFNAVGKYAWPSLPAKDALRRVSEKFRATFRQEEPAPFMSDDSLRWATRKRMNEIVSPPACGSVLREMQATFADWISDDEPSHWLQLVVLPPCDQGDIVRTWAEENDHFILQPPPRDALFSDAVALELSDACGDKVIVVPRLERWFLRHHDGLNLVRGLIDWLSQLKRHCVIGCNSWAWGFLAKAISSELVFPCGLTFESFQARRLRNWLHELSVSGEDAGRTFRLSQSGDELFAGIGGDDAPNNYFHELAAKSLGIPWVAWHLWRGSMRLGPDDEGSESDVKPADEKTLWVTNSEEFTLPKCHVASALLALHALLIHDALTAEEIQLVVPSIDESKMLISLLAAGFVIRDGSTFRCAPAAYPAIRSRLSAAGFPMDRL